MNILKNASIPSTMTADGLDFLGKMARSVPEHGVIVEIGPLFGSSTWVLAKNAHPSVKIFSIDTWEPAPWIDKVEAKYRNCLPFSKEAFLHYTKDCPNVTAIQGWSPDVVSDWDLPIDMFFDDATHGDPGFSENVNFFLPFVRENGILCGDDYSSGWPDIVKVVDALAKTWDVHPEVSGRVWAIRKPDNNGESKPHIFASVSEDNVPSVRVLTSTLSGEKYNLSDGVWSGALHKKDRITSIKLETNWTTPDMCIEWRIRNNKGQIEGPFKSGYAYESSNGSWLSGISVGLVGPDANSYTVEYQSHYCWHTGDGKRYPVSKLHRNGELDKSSNLKLALSAVRITVASNKSLRKTKLQSVVDNFKFLKASEFLKKTANSVRHLSSK